jgi:hypothetical protein
MRLRRFGVAYRLLVLRAFGATGSTGALCGEAAKSAGLSFKGR